MKQHELKLYAVFLSNDTACPSGKDKPYAVINAFSADIALCMLKNMCATSIFRSFRYAHVYLKVDSNHYANGHFYIL